MVEGRRQVNKAMFSLVQKIGRLLEVLGIPKETQKFDEALCEMLMKIESDPHLEEELDTIIEEIVNEIGRVDSSFVLLEESKNERVPSVKGLRQQGEPVFYSDTLKNYQV